MIERDSLLSLEAYAKQRNAFRAKVMEHKKLRTLHLAFAQVTADEMLDQCVFVPVHPGAARYYREAGLQMPRSCLPP